MVGFLVEDEILEVDAVEPIGELLGHGDRIFAGVQRPGGVETEADARTRLSEDEFQGLDRAQPVLRSMVVDGQFDAVFFGQFVGDFPVVGNALQPEIAGHEFQAGELGELEKVFLDAGLVGEALDSDADDSHSGVLIGLQGGLVLGHVAEVDMLLADFDFVQADFLYLFGHLRVGLEAAKAKALDCEIGSYVGWHALRLP
ncbi:MAG: hypothetical protein BWZ10_02740 [candidate division BRC1 bacterium ADurb.BinA364]|nr:MAG: hypothetical protein BWZ10_02740 [candidate division BRC1 bacterium ADurb.BinA364]